MSVPEDLRIELTIKATIAVENTDENGLSFSTLEKKDLAAVVFDDIITEIECLEGEVEGPDDVPVHWRTERAVVRRD